MTGFLSNPLVQPGVTGRGAKKSAFPLALSLLFFCSGAAFFLTAQLKKILYKPFCCADDGYYSMFAKHFALTFSYALPISSEQDIPYDPYNGCGPGLILPAALFIRLIGSQSWVPGLTVLLLFVIQLALTALCLEKRFSLTNTLLYLGTSILGLMVVTTYHDIYSYLMGDVPTFGFLLLGFAILVSDQNKKRGAALAGLCISLSLLTKHIGMFCAMGGLAVWYGRVLYVARFKAFKEIGIFCICLLAPILVFELVRLSSLGWAGYLNNWAGYFSVLHEFHIGPPDRFSVFLNVLSTYGIDATAAIFFAATFALVVALFTTSRWGDAMFGVMLFAGGSVHLLYILFISRLVPRYFWPGMAMITFAALTPILFSGWLRKATMLVAAFTLLATPSALLRSYRFQTSNTSGEGQVAELNRVKHAIEQRPDLPIVGQSWHNSFSVLYSLTTPRKWFLTNDGDKVPGLHALVLVDKRFPGTDYPFGQRVRDLCTDRFPEHSTFTIFGCGDEFKGNR